MDFSDFMEVQRRAKERDPKEFARGVAEDERQLAKREKAMEQSFKMERVTDPETGKTKMSPALLPEETRNVKSVSRPTTGGSGSGSMGTGKMNRDISKPMKKGGKVAGRLATRGYGIAKK